MSNHRRKWILLSALAIVACLILPSSVLAGESDASAAIASAKQQIVACYQAAKDAEAAGANITSLTLALNNAGMLLSNAELAYSKGDFDTALNLAVQSRDSLNSLVSEANVLRDASYQRLGSDFMINVVGSTVGAFAVVVGGATVWFVAKRKRAVSGGEKDDSATV